MKGAVFIALNEMIELEHGIDAWEELLSKVKPSCDGAYVSTEDYPDDDIQSFIIEISKSLKLPSSQVTCIFGRYLFDELNTKFPMFSKETKDLVSFLMSIETVIHKEVRKLFENPSLPTLSCHKASENELIIEYSSPRKLCYLSQGLIQGASEFYSTPISLSHTKCMHNGHENCTIGIQLL